MEEVDKMRRRETEDMTAHTRGLNHDGVLEDVSSNDAGDPDEAAPAVGEETTRRDACASEAPRGLAPASRVFLPRESQGPDRSTAQREGPTQPRLEGHSSTVHQETIFGLMDPGGRKAFSYLGEGLRNLTLQDYDIAATFESTRDAESWVNSHEPPARATIRPRTAASRPGPSHSGRSATLGGGPSALSTGTRAAHVASTSTVMAGAPSGDPDGSDSDKSLSESNANSWPKKGTKPSRDRPPSRSNRREKEREQRGRHPRPPESDSDSHRVARRNEHKGQTSSRNDKKMAKKSRWS
ncbi:hypothetical protein ACA910_007377 [Epithemia clementina (nom. ined.)]